METLLRRIFVCLFLVGWGAFHSLFKGIRIKRAEIALSLCLFLSWSHFTLFPSNSAYCLVLLANNSEKCRRTAVRGMNRLLCGPCSDLSWVWMPGDHVHIGAVLWLPRFVLYGCSKAVTPSQDSSSRSIDPSSSKSIFSQLCIQLPS